jgi:hypothetical protein
MIRRLFNVLAVVSLVLSVMLAALWIASGSRNPNVEIPLGANLIILSFNFPGAMLALVWPAILWLMLRSQLRKKEPPGFPVVQGGPPPIRMTGCDGIQSLP